MSPTTNASVLQSQGGDSFAVTIRRHLDTDYLHPLSIPELAASVGVSPGHLLHTFSRKFGKPPRKYLIEIRVRRARELLESGTPIKCIAKMVGFYDQAHLTRHFRRLVGDTPAHYAAIRREGKCRLD